MSPKPRLNLRDSGGALYTCNVVYKEVLLPE